MRDTQVSKCPTSLLILDMWYEPNFLENVNYTQLKIHMKPPKTLNMQSNPRKYKLDWRPHTLHLQITGKKLYVSKDYGSDIKRNHAPMDITVPKRTPVCSQHIFLKRTPIRCNEVGCCGSQIKT